jgi:hypothetical protein
MSYMKTSIGGLTKLRSTLVILVLGAAAAYFGPETASGAGNYDSSTPFICVPTAVTECVSEGECRPGTAESENLPDFFKVNLKEKTIGSKDQTRLSSIKRIDRTAKDLTLYGTESARAWVLVIQEKTGRMSASVTGNGESFVIFGVCPSP